MDYPQELRDAIAFHEWARVAGWNPHPFPIYERGPKVVHLTLERVLALTLERNKCFCGGSYANERDARAQIEQFLFFVSPGFRFSSTPARIAWARRCWQVRHLRIRYDQAHERIQEFLKLQQVDSLAFKWRPSGWTPSKPDEPKDLWDGLENAYFIPVFIQFFWQAYGMPRAEVLRAPLPQLYQLYRAANPDQKSADQYSAAALWYRSQEREKKE